MSETKGGNIFVSYRRQETSGNGEGSKVTFRLRSGSETHDINLDFPGFRSDVIKVDGERVTRGWINRGKDIPITLGSASGFVNVKMNGNAIGSVIFKIGDQRITHEK